MGSTRVEVSMNAHAINTTPFVLGGLILSGWVLAGIAILRTLGAL